MKQAFQFLTLAVLVSLVIFVIINKNQPPIRPTIPQRVQPMQPVPPAVPQEPIYPLPTFVEFPPVRIASKGGKILSDIISHLPAGNIYEDADLATSGHECEHGINSAIRQKYQGMAGFYCLENRAVTIKNPPIRLTQVGKNIPQVLRGDVYRLYLVSQASSWDSEPLYILDEFSAYTHGTMVGIENNLKRSESCQYMTEFVVYSLGLVKTMKDANVQYDEQELKNYLRWQIERVVNTIKQTDGTNMQSSKALQILETLRTSGEASGLRESAKSFLSPEWTKKVLGF